MGIENALAKRLLHTMLRVRDLDASLIFNVELFGMRLLRNVDYSSGRFTLAFIREAGPMKHGTRVIAFVEDTDRYKVELLERDQGIDCGWTN